MMRNNAGKHSRDLRSFGKVDSDWQLTGTDLKWIALVTMVIDHMGVALLVPGSGLYWAARLIGRLAFPLYCFLLVEGFCHTSDVWNYLRRLVLFALISEIPFDLMNGTLRLDLLTTNGRGFLSGLFVSQNVFFTLALGLIALIGYVRWQNRGQQILAILWCMAMSGFAWLIRADYDFVGVALICIFYRFRHEPQMRTLWGGGTLVLALSPTELPALLDFWLISLYGGQRGNDRWKMMFYVAYPVHLLVLGMLRMIR